MVDALIAGNVLQGDVPAASGDLLKALKVIGDAHQLWSRTVVPLASVSEGVVIVATTHADTVALQVKTDEWQQDQIELARAQSLLRRNGGLRDAITVCSQWLSGNKRGKKEAPLDNFVEDGKKALLAPLPGAVDEGVETDFTITGMIDSDTPAAVKGC